MGTLDYIVPTAKPKEKEDAMKSTSRTVTETLEGKVGRVGPRTLDHVCPHLVTPMRPPRGPPSAQRIQFTNNNPCRGA